ncbi:MAG: hypothetical protein AVDCRST_MAG41-319, partial [uncultured Corynebacteriales bacterium]
GHRDRIRCGPLGPPLPSRFARCPAPRLLPVRRGLGQLLLPGVGRAAAGRRGDRGAVPRPAGPPDRAGRHRPARAGRPARRRAAGRPGGVLRPQHGRGGGVRGGAAVGAPRHRADPPLRLRPPRAGPAAGRRRRPHPQRRRDPGRGRRPRRARRRAAGRPGDAGAGDAGDPRRLPGHRDLPAQAGPAELPGDRDDRRRRPPGHPGRGPGLGRDDQRAVRPAGVPGRPLLPRGPDQAGPGHPARVAL